MAESILKAGHEIGHHGYHHLLPDPGDPWIEEELERGFEALKRRLGVRPTGYRAPYGEFTEELRVALVRHGIVYTSSFVCEAIRSGINTVPVGQAEAARALGMGFNRVLTTIVLPQAFRATIGPLASVLIALTKNTTVAAIIGVSEAALLMSEMVENESDKLIIVFLLFALGFVFLTLPIGLVLGRVATEVARVLRGKHKPIYAPHVDTGDHVIIVNADKIVLTAGKADKKMVYRHSGYPGGLRSQTYANLLEVKPTDAVRKSVRGMLPKNRLGRQMLKKLKVYTGPNHPHTAQKPQPLLLEHARRKA